MQPMYLGLHREFPQVLVLYNVFGTHVFDQPSMR